MYDIMYMPDSEALDGDGRGAAAFVPFGAHRRKKEKKGVIK